MSEQLDLAAEMVKKNMVRVSPRRFARTPRLPSRPFAPAVRPFRLSPLFFRGSEAHKTHFVWTIFFIEVR